MADMSMTAKLFGQDVSASKALQKVGREAGKTGGAFKGMGATAAGVFGGMGLAAVGTKIAAFGKQSVDAYANAAKEVKTLKRYLGGTAEEASKLRAAAHMSGVSTEDLARGLGKMSKFAYAGAIQLTAFEEKTKAAAASHKPLHASLGKSAQMFKNLGVETKNQNGSLRSTNSVLMDLADKFKTMPNGIEKTSMVMSVFGKSGMGLLPFLNRGADGLKELGIEAEKTGNVLSEKDLKATTDATMAKRHLHEAVEGLQISLGRELYPMFTKVALVMSGKVVPGVKSVLDFMGRNKAVIGPLALIIGGLVGSLWAFVKVTKVITAVQAAWAVVTALFTTTEEAATGSIWANTAALLANPLTWVVIAIVAVVAAIVLMIMHWRKVKEVFVQMWQGMKKAAIAVFNWLKPAFRVIGTVILGYVNLWIKGINMIFGLLNKIPHIKMFGYNVGFDLPTIKELTMPSMFNSSSAARPSLARGGTNVTVNVAGHVMAERDLATTVRDQIAQTIRRRGLSPAVLGV